MGKTFKVNPDSGEETTRMKRYGNSRKKRAIEVVKERRKQRREIGELYDKMFDPRYDDLE